TAGELRAGEGDAIDADTLFKIASNSKAMTTALLARLVDAGKLRWDDPVTKHLPTFRMSDPWVTRQIQVRDLLIHNSGLGAGAGDLMLWPEPNAFTRADVIAGLAHLRPAYSFRSRYAYDNTLYVVAGEVAAAAGGAPYAQLLEREVFAPLGMDGCRVGAWARSETPNLAQPHQPVGDRNTVVRADGDSIPETPMAAAGGVRCGLDDMLRWVQAWLRPDAAWLSSAQREAAWTAQTPMPLSARMRAWDDSHFSAYGYGWRLTDVDGTAKVSHTGTLAGMYSAVTLLPQRGVGFVVLINGEAEEARTVLTQVLVKQVTDPAARADVASYAARLRDERPDGARQAPGVSRSSSRPASHPASGQAVLATAETATDTASVATSVGRASPRHAATPASLGIATGLYRDPWFGDVSICPAGGGVRFRAHKSAMLSGPVLHAGDGLLVDWDALGADADAWLHAGGKPGAADATLTMSKVDPEADFSYDFEDLAFTRVASCPAR
ncbi:MAG TPA: serine hydrolase domain-containing protein, partial [Luteimonas sp.]|nr:serine hydrolase domain-containing protein [Luteimonas sp.]